MPLPVLNARGGATPTDLLRYFARAELHWSRHVAEETQLDFGVALTNPELPGVIYANRMVDVALPPDVSPLQAVAAGDAHFAAVGTRCLSWVIDPAAPGEKTVPIADHLRSLGYARQVTDVMYLRSAPPSPIVEVGGLQIIPARASFKHARVLFEEFAAQYEHAPLAEASMLHLDDSHVDALLALRDGVPAAYVTVLSTGDVGTIVTLFVSAPFRNQGVGRTMMSRAMEICARSQFRHVFLDVAQENAAAKHLYVACGFGKIGEMLAFDAPARSEVSS